MAKPTLVHPDHRGVAKATVPVSRRMPLFGDSPNKGPATPVTPRQRRFGTDITNTIQQRTPIRFGATIQPYTENASPGTPIQRNGLITPVYHGHTRPRPRVPVFAPPLEQDKLEQKPAKKFPATHQTNKGKVTEKRQGRPKSRLLALVQSKTAELQTLGAISQNEEAIAVEDISVLNSTSSIGWTADHTPTLILNPRKLPMENDKLVTYTKVMNNVVIVRPRLLTPN